MTFAVLSASTGVAQEAPATQPTTQPTTQPAEVAAPAPVRRAARTNGNGVHGVTTQPGGGLVLNFQDASIDAVLDELSSAAGFIVIKEAKPQGRVTLVSKQPVTPTDAVALLNSVLKNAGYAAIQQERVLKIVDRTSAKKANIPVRTGSDPSKIPVTDEMITQVIPLREADAVQLKKDITPLISSDADFTANASSNALVITDTSANIHRIVEIVAALDTSLADAAIVKVIKLEYANAANAAKLIQEVFGDQNRNSQQQGRDSSNPIRQFFERGGLPFGPPGGGSDRGSRGGSGGDSGAEGARRAPKVTASADDRTNTVVVTGPSDTLTIIEKVIKELDSNPAADDTVFIYRLKNAQSLNVESVMNTLFNGTSTGSNRGTGSNNSGNSNINRGGRLGSSNSSGSSRLGSGGSSFGSSGSSIGSSGSSFGSSRSSSSSPFGSSSYGGGGFFGSSGGLSSSSQRTAADLSGQVSIIADPDTNSMLIRTNPKNYEKVRAVLDELDRAVAQVLIKVLIAEVTHDDGSDIGTEFSVLNLRASGNGQKLGTNFGVAAASGGLVVQALETNVTATLRALENIGKLDVLSRPYILASDNQLASITVGQEVPFITNSRITDTGDTINTIEYDDIGILLDVQPHINPDGMVILDVAPEISQLTGTTVPISSTVSAPVIAKRSAQSRVAVMDGQTIVIGGLMEDRKTETIDKVPLLGDIPGLGLLFQRKQEKKTKTELLIFLTPHVAARPDMLQDMGKQEVGGTKLVPKAVTPTAFPEHIDGLNRGQAAPVPPPTPPPADQNPPLAPPDQPAPPK